MSNSNKLGGLAVGAFFVGAGCLTVSMFQATGLIINHVSDPLMKWLIVLGVGCALLTSQWLVRAFIPLARTAKGGLWCFAIAVLFCTVGVIESFSVSSSAVTFDGGIIQATRDQNLNSPERAQLKDQADLIKSEIQSDRNEIQSLRKTKSGLSADRVTNRNEIDKDIARIEYKIKKAKESIRDANNGMNDVNVSVVGQAFSGLEATTGISQSNIGFIFGLLMTLCPMAVNLVMGALSSATPAPVSSGGSAGKKPQARKSNVVRMAS